MLYTDIEKRSAPPEARRSETGDRGDTEEARSVGCIQPNEIARAETEAL